MEAHAITESEHFSQSDEQYAALRSRLLSKGAATMTHTELEQVLHSDGMELQRRMFEDHLTLRAIREREHGLSAPVVGADGVERTHHRPETERGLMSLFGPVRVERAGYGARGHVSLHPVDAALNLPREEYSLGVRRVVAEQVSKVSFDEAVTTVSSLTGARVPKRQAEELAVRAAFDFDLFYETRQMIDEAERAAFSELLILTTDGKGVCVRKKDLREQTRIAAEARTHKLKRRLTKGEKKNVKRMATVAAVYTIAPFVRTPEDVMSDLKPVRDATSMRRPRPECKRVWASLKKDPEVVLREAFEEALRRDPEREKTWVALSDGNETQLFLLEKLAAEYGVPITIVLDVIHVSEYLWKAVTAFHAEGSKDAEAWVSERLLQVLRGKASDVAGGIRRSATLRGLSAEARRPVDKCANYILKYPHYVRYDRFLKLGLPIATGVIEGACRHLIKDRMDITGARWCLARAEAVLQLRALRSSGDFDAYWAFHLAQEHRRNHAAFYDGDIPVVRQPSRRRSGRAHLQVVK